MSKPLINIELPIFASPNAIMGKALQYPFAQLLKRGDNVLIGFREYRSATSNRVRSAAFQYCRSRGLTFKCTSVKERVYLNPAEPFGLSAFVTTGIRVSHEGMSFWGKASLVECLSAASLIVRLSARDSLIKNGEMSASECDAIISKALLDAQEDESEDGAGDPENA